MFTRFFEHQPSPSKNFPEKEIDSVPFIEFVGGKEVISTLHRRVTDEDKAKYPDEWKAFVEANPKFKD